MVCPAHLCFAPWFITPDGLTPLDVPAVSLLGNGAELVAALLILRSEGYWLGSTPGCASASTGASAHLEAVGMVLVVSGWRCWAPCCWGAGACPGARRERAAVDAGAREPLSEAASVQAKYRCVVAGNVLFW